MSDVAPMGGHETAGAAQAWRLRALWALAQDVSRYLRRHSSGSVRLAAALLLAASLAACNASASDRTTVETRAVAPLTEEVVSGLPRGPGTYPVVKGSVFRDQRGVYQFEWQETGPAAGDAAGASHVAYASRLRLARDETLALEMPESGDPILHVPAGEDVGLIEEARVGVAQPGPAYYPPVYSYWNPFLPGMLLLGRPAYYDPPRTVIVERDPAQSVPAGGVGTAGRPAPRVEGGTASETARPPAARVTGVQSAVGGRAGGTGAGSAVTSRNVTSGASSASQPASSSASGVRASGSSSSSSSNGSSVSAPRSSGFSSGVGSSGGSAAS